MTSETRPIGTRFKRPLTKEEMAAIESALREGGPGQHGPAHAMIALWDIILGEAEGTTLGAATSMNAGYKPNDYAIPESQKVELVALMQKGRRAQVRHSVSLSWLNSGPAVYSDTVDS